MGIIEEAALVAADTQRQAELRAIRAQKAIDAKAHPVERARISWQRFVARQAAQTQAAKKPRKPRKTP